MTDAAADTPDAVAPPPPTIWAAVKEAVRGENPEEEVRKKLYEAVGIKPDEHHDEEGTERRMSQIGG